MLPYVYNLGRPTFRRFALNYNPIKIVRMFNKAVDVQNDLAEEAISSRQKLIAEGYDLSLEPGRGRDFVTLLSKNRLSSLLIHFTEKLSVSESQRS